MATISASVGLNGKNLPEDVITIQQMLNNVSASDGGPLVPLEVDGLSGPKTRNAIQKFQLHHFGWSIADGRVDPGKQTLAKLNEFQPSTLPPPPPQPPAPVAMRMTHFVFQQPGKIDTKLSNPEDFFVRVIGGRNTNPSQPSSFSQDVEALFFFGIPGGHLAISKQPVFGTAGVPITFLTLQPPGITLAELNCPAMYTTNVQNGRLSSRMILFITSTGPTSRTGPTLNMGRHLIDLPTSSSSLTSTSRAGNFQLVKTL